MELLVLPNLEVVPVSDRLLPIFECVEMVLVVPDLELAVELVRLLSLDELLLVFVLAAVLVLELESVLVFDLVSGTEEAVKLFEPDFAVLEDSDSVPVEDVEPDLLVVLSVVWLTTPELVVGSLVNFEPDLLVVLLSVFAEDFAVPELLAG